MKSAIRSRLQRVTLATASICLGLLMCWDREILSAEPPRSPAEATKRKASLDTILRLLPSDRTSSGRVSFLDETFKDWLARTGELPPDFDQMPSIPFLPDPLVLDEGTKNVPVTNKEQWQEKRAWMKRQLEHYITGTRPPEPDNVKATVLDEKKDGEVTLRMVELTFGPENRATLTVELMIPPGKGPFPVFLTQWTHREWAQIAVRRGYIGCIYAGADNKDDTEKYSEIWAGKYDFTRLMRRAYGASRAVDYLYTLPFVDKDKIGITGHSRNGKQSLIAAAFDERITACIPSSGGTGAEMPWRYCSINYDIEDIALLGCGQPSWLHPRLRFFIGREDKLPIDQNSFMALIAPRGLMLSTAITEGASNPWGMEQAYHASQKVYDFLRAGDRVAIRSRYGNHSVSARDMEDYIDFFDYVFGRTNRKPDNRLLYDYSFEKWRKLSGEQVDLHGKEYPAKGLDDLKTAAATNGKIATVADWERKRADIKRTLRWALGDEPPGVTNPGPKQFRAGGAGENSFGSFLQRPAATKKMGMAAIAPYNGFGDQLFGYLYYPINGEGALLSNKTPVVIYLHEFDYSKGFNSYHQVESLFQNIVAEGFAVFAFDMLGFGNRIEEGTRFYERYPHWSKMGKMVVDVRGAVESLRNMEGIDPNRIYVAGYSLGAKVGLYAAALDERIAGVISVAGFTPVRLSTAEKGIEGIRADSHLHGLLPRLGFFVGSEARVPYDYHEVLACIAPRPVLVVAPAMDKDAIAADVRHCVDETKKIYRLYGATDRLQLSVPDDYNRFSTEMRATAYQWLRDRTTESR